MSEKFVKTLYLKAEEARKELVELQHEERRLIMEAARAEQYALVLISFLRTFHKEQLTTENEESLKKLEQELNSNR